MPGWSRSRGDGALNAFPMVNLVTLLVPTALMAGAFVASALGVGQADAPAPLDPGVVDLRDIPDGLGVVVGPDGYVVLWASDEADTDETSWGIPIPCRQTGCAVAEAYDTEELVRILSLVKDAHPEEQRVTVVPGPRTPYDVVVRTTEATRRDPSRSIDGEARVLFPFAVVSGSPD